MSNAISVSANNFPHSTNSIIKTEIGFRKPGREFWSGDIMCWSACTMAVNEKSPSL